MNSGVVRLGHIMPILVTMNKHVLEFCFVYAEHNLVKLKLYYNWSAQAVNIISKYVMWNSSKPIKLAYL